MSTLNHTIKAILYPNPMKNAKSLYLARSAQNATLDIREICEQVCDKPGTNTNADELEYHVNLFLNTVADLLADGHKINTGYFNAQACIKGSFNSMNDNFDDSRHRVEIAFSAGSLIRRRAAILKGEILHSKAVTRYIESVTDAQTGLFPPKLIPNKLLVVRGNKIKITGTHPDVGLYLVNTENNAEIRLSDTLLYQNSHTTIRFFVPDIPAGSYQLQVCTQYTGNATPLAQPCVLTYSHLLLAE
ncbi:MAG: hypothetical protein H6Q20_1534 [Bacteroidetes bacterium]|nr:hypothetical protein [Bacteroidota bacterium]